MPDLSSSAAPARPPAEALATPPRTQTERALAELWGNILGAPPTSVQESFFNLGGNSLLAVRLLTEIEQRFQRSVSLEPFLQAPTLEQLARLLDEPAGDWPTLVPLQPRGDRPPFFCVHGGGGRVLHFYDIVPYLAANQPFWGIQAPRLAPGAPRPTVAGLAARYIQELQTHQPHGPYYLGGLCFGGHVAYEMAQQLRAAGAVVAWLGLFDTALWPGGWRFTLAFADYRLRRRLDQRRRQGRRPGQPPAPHPADTPTVPLNEQAQDYIIQAVARYRPQPYAGAITCFLGEATRPRYPARDRRLGWQHLATGGLELVHLPGAEWQMFTEPHAPRLAAALQTALTAAQRPAAGR